jgi:tRNA threonylcarbamoyladenosine biosynthesis protein TsaB
VIVLGLETSGQPGSVALLGETGVLAFSNYDQPNSHAEQLIEHIESALRSAHCIRQDIGKIAVGTGPGNFTGLRMGMALAGGIAMALDKPVAGVCSLATIACAIEAPDIAVRFVVRDARRGELFCAAFTDMGQEVIAPALVGVDLFDAWLISHAASYIRGDVLWALAGDGLRHLDVPSLAARGAYIPENATTLMPDARQTATLGARMQAPESVAPNYVREADVILPNLARNSQVESFLARGTVS